MKPHLVVGVGLVLRPRHLSVRQILDWADELVGGCSCWHQLSYPVPSQSVHVPSLHSLQPTPSPSQSTHSPVPSHCGQRGLVGIVTWLTWMTVHRVLVSERQHTEDERRCRRRTDESAEADVLKALNDEAVLVDERVRDHGLPVDLGTTVHFEGSWNRCGVMPSSTEVTHRES